MPASSALVGSAAVRGVRPRAAFPAAHLVSRPLGVDRAGPDSGPTIGRRSNAALGVAPFGVCVQRVPPGGWRWQSFCAKGHQRRAARRNGPVLGVRPGGRTPESSQPSSLTRASDYRSYVTRQGRGLPTHLTRPISYHAHARRTTGVRRGDWGAHESLDGPPRLPCRRVGADWLRSRGL
jgi:hypothetical protein